MSLEDTLIAWAARSSPTEQDKQDRTLRMVQETIAQHGVFRGARISVFAKGSYANQTNVRIDSDVDIAVQCHEAFYWEEEAPGAHSPGPSYSGPWTPNALRAAVERALSSKFVSEVSSPGSIAVKVKSSSARIDADVVPCFDYRYCFVSGTYREGTRIFSKTLRGIDNFPRQHLSKGNLKMVRTLNRFKPVVRILKRVENAMREEDYHREVESFFIESLVYNCPDSLFFGGTWSGIVQGVLHCIWETTQGDTEPQQGRWLEVSECKYLFSQGQTWSREDARDFAFAAWNYLGLG
jgi:hypothetical protein